MHTARIPLVQVKEVARMIDSQTSLVKALAHTEVLATKRYTAGVDSYLGVLDAARAHYAAKQGLVEMRLLNMVSQVQLYSALGGGRTDEP